MLYNIKSSYIIENVFSFIEQKSQMKIVVHNKKLQYLLNFTLKIYKNISGIYRIIEKTGFGTEKSLKTNKIIFKGQYLNGKRHGKGTEYNSKGNKLFEGSYINGKKCGKGKEYSNIGNKLIFEGEYKNNERDGAGKEYFNGKVIFDGKYLDGKIWNGKGFSNDGKVDFVIKNGKGHIKEYNENRKLIFEGEILNGLREGKGKEYFLNGKLYYEGDYKKGIKCGKGIQYNDFGWKVYEGDFSDDERNGIGKEYTINDVSIYDEGEFKNDKKNGLIKYYVNGILRAESVYVDDECCGKIKEYGQNGKLIFEGEYSNDFKNGFGRCFRNDEEVFLGEFKNNKRWVGEGKEFISEFYGKDIRADFIGTYKEGKRTGKIKEYDKNHILVFDGEIIDEIKNGKGLEYDNQGNLLFKGEYKDGKYWTGKFYNDNGDISYDIKEGTGYGFQYYFDCENGYKKYKSYEGPFKNGEKNGLGKGFSFFVKDKLNFEGEFVDGKKNGQGKEYLMDEIIFEGEYKDDKRWKGKGKEYKKRDDDDELFPYEDDRKNYELIFEGEYLDGKWTGFGKEYRDDKLRFKGEYLNGQRNGQGKEFKDGKMILSGEYKDNKIWKGKGTLYDEFDDEILFEGEFIDGKYWKGKGKEIEKTSDYEYVTVFDGEYSNGKRWNGEANEIRKGKSIFKGKYKDGKRWEGKGKEFDDKDKIIFDGTYSNGKKIKSTNKKK